MNKTLLLTGAAVLFASQAMAAQDITGAFAVPGKGQISSDTSIGMSRANTKWSASILGMALSSSEAKDGMYASEFIEYGVTDKFSINAGITNTFDKDGGYGGDPISAYIGFRQPGTTYNNDHNFAYQLGAKYNTSYEDLLFQISGHYATWQPQSWYGRDNNAPFSDRYDRWQKSLGLDLKAGLDLGNGITPYIIYSIDSAIDVAHRPLEQSVTAGIHKFTGKWALDGAIRYEWTKNDKDWFEKNSTEWWLDASADYYLKDNIVIGAYGSYLMDSKDKTGDPYGIGLNIKEHQSTTYEVGLHVKFLF